MSVTSQIAEEREPHFSALRRTFAMLLKEFIQLKRDRVSFAMIIMIPVMQLLLFGYAINTTPRNLPTAVLLQEDSDLARSVLKALENTAYFKFTHQVRTVEEFDGLLLSGTVLFGVEIPRGFERAVRRGEHPSLLVAADATDPVASSSAMAALNKIAQTALLHDRVAGDVPLPPFEVRAHARYNPAGSSRLNIVPGLTGTILTLTMLIFTALSVTREVERGTMEALLSMPITPVEIMLGKIVPYVLIGFVQAALIIGLGISLFGVPIYGSLMTLALLSTLFITSMLAVGYTVDDVLPAQHPSVRLHVSIRWHANLGAMDRRGVAADALPAYRAGDHAEGCDAGEPAVRVAGAAGPDPVRHDHRRDPLPPYAGLER
jgi:ABC-2 type transport system permease protein